LAASDQLAAAAIYPNGTPSQPLQNGAKRAPETREKPGHLSSKPLAANSGAGRMSLDAGADLHARFSRLRGDSGVSVKDLPASLVPGIGRPQGPRSMPTQALQIDVKNVLPQVPPPVYSPSASYGSPRGLSPPRSTRAVQPDIVKPKLPPDTEIQVTAEALYKYLKAGSGSVLLLDVRPSEEYDQGHIFTRSIVSIDPIILRQG
jgi:ubiquitin carboxyl-terminal hydrolase 8